MPLQKTLLLLFLLTALAPAAAQSFSKSETPESWSQKQMRHMLADRPVMKTYLVGGQTLWVRQQDSIWQWVAKRYAGKTTQFWTAWHEAAPTEGFEAMHAYAQDKAYIYLKDLPAQAASGHNETFEQLWSKAVFELLNLENAQGFRAAATAAYEGKCTRNEFVRKYAALEHQALGKMQRFYTEVWLPWCNTSGFVCDPKIWRHSFHPDFKTWLAQYPQDSLYPWQDYGEGYESIRKQAREAAQKVRTQVK